MLDNYRDIPLHMADCKPKADAADAAAIACGDGKVPQSQRPGGKKRMVAVFVAFVGAGYSVSVCLPH